MERVSQESCTGLYVSACIGYLYRIRCASEVVTQFLTMSELVEWIESFCTLGNETMVIADGTKISSEIGCFFRLWKVLHSLNLFKKLLGACT